jgi:hypothetical protein
MVITQDNFNLMDRIDIDSTMTTMTTRISKWAAIFLVMVISMLITPLTLSAASSKAVIGPATTTTTNGIAIWVDGTAYKLKNSTATIDSSGNMTINGDLEITGNFPISSLTVMTLTVTNVAVWNFGRGSTTNDFTVGTDFATTRSSLTCANGANNNLTATTSFMVVTGPSGSFSISGFTAPTIPGKRVVIANLTGQAMTITHQATSSAANQITTMTGSDLVSTGNGTVELVYDSGTSKWIAVGWQP